MACGVHYLGAIMAVLILVATVLFFCFALMAVPVRYLPNNARAGWGKFAPVAITVGPCDFCNFETGDPCVTHR